MMNDIHIKTADDIIYHLVRDPIRLIVDELVMIEVEFIIVIISRKLVNFIMVNMAKVTVCFISIFRE